MNRHPAPLAVACLAAGLAFPRAGAAQTPYKGHGAGSVPAEAIAPFAPKPLPPEVAAHIQTMMDVRAPGLGVPAPSGSRLFFGWSVTGTPQVWRLDGPDRFPVQLTGGEDRTSVAGVTPDGRWLIVQRDRKGEENPGLYLLPADGGPLAVVQHLPNVQTFFDFVSPDGKWVYFHANDQKPDSYAVYRWNLGARVKEQLVAEPGLWSIADHRPDGRLLLQKSTGALSSEYSDWDPATRKLSPVLGQGETVEYDARYGAGDGQVLVLTPKIGDFRRLYTFEKGQLRPITPEMKWDVSGFGIDESRRRILYTVNEGGFTRLAALDARTLQPLALPKLPEGADHVYSGATTADGRFTTIGVETATAPRASYVYDWQTGALTRWVVPSAPEVDTSSFAVARLETYPARDGTPIPVLVRRPPRCEPEPCPVIVEFHGGPEGQSQPGFSTYAQIFVDAGFVYAEPNVRGSDGYGKAWLAADDGPKRLRILTDIEDAATWARKSFAAAGRAPKVGVMGGSYGGYSTLIAMTKFAGAYDAGVSIVGISNLLTFLENTAPYRRILRITEYGDPVKDHDALVELSPVTHIGRLKAPLQIQGGATDPRVPVGEALQMYEAARKTGVPTELIVFPDEGHGAGRRENQVLMIGHALRWMSQYLKGEGAR
ncbi:MAG TPA: prolyl oligopeptidase family serine peptidase [Vicinamibacteria bacterium]|nr:prolyl oligopeptidase family serine peptidase [Vicinamibacteria bacterium]